MIATDGSATADRAARKGFELAEALEASVTIVFVGHPKTGDLVTQDTIATYAGVVKTDVARAIGRGSQSRHPGVKEDGLGDCAP